MLKKRNFRDNGKIKVYDERSKKLEYASNYVLSTC